MTRAPVRLLALAALAAAAGCGPSPTGTAARTPAEPETVVEGLDTPWAIAFLPDGRMMFTERGGRVSVLENGSPRMLANLAVEETGEGGLHGIAVDPGFAGNRFVYIYYTHRTANRVSRFVLREGGLREERVILDGIPRARFHNGGRVRFGPDGKLYVTTGDALEPRLAQDRNSPAGKILRLNTDGTAPGDNPFGSAVWAYGLRNPQGIAWSAAGELYASSHGPTRRDEIDRIERGGNYGWPRTCDERSDFLPAVRCYTEFTLAPCGVAFSGDDLYVAGLRGEQVRRLRIRNGSVVEEEEFLTGMGRIRDVAARDGWLYAATSNRDGRGRPRSGDDRIVRIRMEPAAVSSGYGFFP